MHANGAFAREMGCSVAGRSFSMGNACALRRSGYTLSDKHLRVAVHVGKERVQNGRAIPCDSEAAIFEALGLKYKAGFCSVCVPVRVLFLTFTHRRRPKNATATSAVVLPRAWLAHSVRGVSQ